MRWICVFLGHKFVYQKPVDSYKSEPEFTEFCVRCGIPRPNKKDD